MKKISVFILALVCLLVIGQAIAATPGNRQSPGVGDILGQGGLDSEGNKIFRLVRYVPAGGSDNSATLTKDSVVIWDKISDDGVTVTVTTTSYDSAVAGVVVVSILTPEEGTLGNNATQDIGKRNWGWLQTYGLSQVDLGSDQIATVGGKFGTTVRAGGAGLSVASTSSATANGAAGFFYNTSAAGGTNIPVFVQID